MPLPHARGGTYLHDVYIPRGPRAAWVPRPHHGGRAMPARRQRRGAESAVCSSERAGLRESRHVARRRPSAAAPNPCWCGRRRRSSPSSARPNRSARRSTEVVAMIAAARHRRRGGTSSHIKAASSSASMADSVSGTSGMSCAGREESARRHECCWVARRRRHRGSWQRSAGRGGGRPAGSAAGIHG